MRFDTSSLWRSDDELPTALEWTVISSRAVRVDDELMAALHVHADGFQPRWALWAVDDMGCPTQTVGPAFGWDIGLDGTAQQLGRDVAVAEQVDVLAVPAVVTANASQMKLTEPPRLGTVFSG